MLQLQIPFRCLQDSKSHGHYSQRLTDDGIYVVSPQLDGRSLAVPVIGFNCSYVTTLGV